jgi:hypothetical protein
MNLFLEISLPLMAIIVTAWFLVYLWVKRKEPKAIPVHMTSPFAGVSGSGNEKERQAQVTTTPVTVDS